MSAPTVYAVLRVSNLPRSLEDEATALLFAAGADGVAEDLRFVQRDLRYDPEIVEAAELDLKAYFAVPPSESDRLRVEGELRELHASAQLSFAVENSRDWLEEWKKGFQAFLFADPFWVVPRWLPVPPEAREALLIEPGMAFGTGTHETTRLAARAIVAARGWMPGARVLDVGCGTAILALIAERLGAREAVGLDIDPEARRTARENLQLNSARRTRIDDDALAEHVSRVEPYDFVVANIIDGVLLTLATDLARAVVQGGHLLLSGILTDREEEFHREFAARTGFTELSRTREGEWVSSMWRRA
ncbi:MAG TPA: 50S ribosomal protein L11 methyltransferase [Pseudobdellovibrionaceae bacterium]|nr:50S ribosomal protein L11 methyltransferase [Pseudobdellovibrionaceae bacterium]